MQQSVIMLADVVGAVVGILFLSALDLHAYILAIRRQIEGVALFLGILVRFEECQECRVQSRESPYMLEGHLTLATRKLSCIILTAIESEGAVV